MRTLDFEQPYDELFDADNRNEEAKELSALWLHDTFNNKHKLEGINFEDYYPLNNETAITF